eukprot:UN29294
MSGLERSKTEHGGVLNFNFNPEHFHDPKFAEAFKSIHFQDTNKPESAETILKLVHNTLRRLGHTKNLGLPSQMKTDEELSEEEEKKNQFVESIVSTMKNETNYPNGTIVEVFSTKSGRWVLGEVIGAKSEHAVNVRYLKQNKFVNPHDDGAFRLIEKVVGTPFGVGFLENIRHEDHFCTVLLDWGRVMTRGENLSTIKVQSMDIFPVDNGARTKEISGNLLVKVVKAFELPKTDLDGGCDPYCEVKVPQATEEQKFTKIIRRNTNPKWDDVLDFKTFRRKENDKIVGDIHVWDHDGRGKADLIGTAEFKLPTLADTVTDQILDLYKVEET